MLVYASVGSSSGGQLGWFDRAGKRLGLIGSAGDNSYVRFSPDEKQVAVSRFDLQTRHFNTWLLNLSRGADSRLSFTPGGSIVPIWSPDGSRTPLGVATETSIKRRQAVLVRRKYCSSQIAGLMPATGQGTGASLLMRRTIRKEDWICGCCRSKGIAGPNPGWKRPLTKPTPVSLPTPDGSLTFRMSQEAMRVYVQVFVSCRWQGRVDNLQAPTIQPVQRAMGKTCSTSPTTES